MFPQPQLQGQGVSSPMQQECLQDRRGTIQSIDPHHPALLRHLDLLPVILGDAPLVSKLEDCSHQQNRGQQMSQGLQTDPDFGRCPTMNVMHLLRAMICLSWEVQRSNSQSAWSKLNYPYSDLQTRWGMLTIVRSTSGRRYGWLGWWRKVSVQYLGAELFETASKCTPALDDSCYILVPDIQGMATIGSFGWCWMDSVAVDCDVLEEMCKWYSGGEEKVKVSEHRTSDGCGRTPRPKHEK